MPTSRKVFRVRRQKNTVIVSPQGEAPGFRTAALETELNRLLRQLDELQPVNLIVDLGGTNYYGSAMIGAIFELRRKVLGGGGRAVLCNASEAMLDVLRVLKLDREWPYVATRAEAFARLRAPEDD
jgi:anti-anti-sigma factor